MTKFRLTKNDGVDIGFAFSCMGYAITWQEFQTWVERVIAISDVDDLPHYMFEIPLMQSARDLWEECPRGGVFGFRPGIGLSDQERLALYGIGFLRKLPNLMNPDPAFNMPSKDEALTALKQHPEILQEFKRLFDFLEIPAPE